MRQGVFLEAGAGAAAGAGAELVEVDSDFDSVLLSVLGAAPSDALLSALAPFA